MARQSPTQMETDVTKETAHVTMSNHCPQSTLPIEFNEDETNMHIKHDPAGDNAAIAALSESLASFRFRSLESFESLVRSDAKYEVESPRLLFSSESLRNDVCTDLMQTAGSTGDYFQNVFKSRSLAWSQEFLDNDPFFVSSENVDCSLFISGASLDDLPGQDDLEVENEAANCSSQKHGNMCMNDDPVTRVWCRDDEEHLTSESGKRRSPLESKKTHVVSESGKRRAPSQPKQTRVQTNAGIAPAKRAKKTSMRQTHQWSKEEDTRLKEGVKLYKLPNWKSIAEHVKTRSNKMCRQRWRFTLRPEIKSVKKGSWSTEEDQRLRQIVSKHKLKNARIWDIVSQSMQFTRSCLQCRERWTNFVDPTLKSGPWTAEEDALLRSLYDECGNRWKQFTSALVGRSAMHIRRRFGILRAAWNEK